MCFWAAQTNPVGCSWYTATNGHSFQRDEHVDVDWVFVSYLQLQRKQKEVQTFLLGTYWRCCGVSLWRHSNLVSAFSSWPLWRAILNTLGNKSLSGRLQHNHQLSVKSRPVRFTCTAPNQWLSQSASQYPEAKIKTSKTTTPNSTQYSINSLFSI